MQQFLRHGSYGCLPLCASKLITLTQDEISTEPEPKVFLQNRLSRAQVKLSELAPLVDAKSEQIAQYLITPSSFGCSLSERESSRLEELVVAYTANPKLGSVDDVMDVSYT